MATYHMRRQDKRIEDPAEIDRILSSGKYLVLGLAGREGPYVVTLSYGWEAGPRRCWFHAARQGRKLDLLAEDPRASATVIEDLGYKAGDCDHRFRSVVMSGRIRLVEDPAEKRHGVSVLLGQLEPDPEEVRRRLAIDDAALAKIAVLCLEVESLEGKAAP